MRTKRQANNTSNQNAPDSQSRIDPKNAPGLSPAWRELDELESAIRQAHSLYLLVEHQVQYPIDGEWSDDIKCGIAELGGATFRRLNAAEYSLRAAMRRGIAKD